MLAVALWAALSMAAAPLPDCALNQARWLGSHNSFKPVLPAAYYETLANRLQQPDGTAAKQQALQKLQSLRYGHASLTSQLNSGLRLLELDFLKDDAGGSFARPLFGAELKQALPQQTQQDLSAQYFPATLTQPGFKVLHLPDIDFASHCVRARDCIAALAQWSKTNPGHWPVLIVINVREQGAGAYLPANIAAHAAKVAPWQAQDYQALEQLWLDGLGRKRLLTPDDVRQSPLSLAASIRMA